MNRKNDRKVLSLLLATVMLLGAVPFGGSGNLFAPTASALVVREGDYYFEVKNDCAIITGVEPSISGDVIIPSTLGGYPVTGIGYAAFANRHQLTGITIPNGVTSIGRSAFNYCQSLTSISIPDTVTAVCMDSFFGTGYYNNAANWENNVLYIGKFLIDSDTSLPGNYVVKDGTTVIAEEAFLNNSSITSITIPASLTIFGINAFLNCINLTSFDVADNNPNYSSVDGVLFNKEKTDIIKYPAGNTRASYTIPNSVTAIRYTAFDNCEFLSNITIPNSVTDIAEMAFYDCELLINITIPNSVISIGKAAFYYCTSLTNVTIESGVPSIGMWAFGRCYALISVTIPESVTNIGEDAFADHNSDLTIFGVPGSYAEIYANENDINFSPIETGYILNPVAGSSCVIDREVCIIYGLEPGITREQFESDFVSVRSGYSRQYSADVIGTGTVVNAVQNGSDEVVESYTIIIFGDLNGDGMIDSIDSGAVIDYENFFVDWDPSTDYARLKAGDVNGDGIVDSMDSAIIVDVENYIVEINQSTGLIAG